MFEIASPGARRTANEDEGHLVLGFRSSIFGFRVWVFRVNRV